MADSIYSAECLPVLLLTEENAQDEGLDGGCGFGAEVSVRGSVVEQQFCLHSCIISPKSGKVPESMIANL